jgi:hypothetical protein
MKGEESKVSVVHGNHTLGGTDSALRLVTCWSSDALRLSSSGRTGRESPFESGRSLRYPLAFLLPSPELR